MQKDSDENTIRLIDNGEVVVVNDLQEGFVAFGAADPGFRYRGWCALKSPARIYLAGRRSIMLHSMVNLLLGRGVGVIP